MAKKVIVNPVALAEIELWISNGCEFHSGCNLYHKWGTNIILKTQNFIPSKRFPAVENHLKKELCAIAGIQFDPMRPEDLKKKSEDLPLQQSSPSQAPVEKVQEVIIPEEMPQEQTEVLPTPAAEAISLKETPTPPKKPKNHSQGQKKQSPHKKSS